MKNRLVSSMLVLLSFSFFLFFGCASESDSDSSTNDSDSVLTYKGPGSIWALDASGDTFTLAETDDGSTLMSVKGKLVDLSSGFKQLTVTSATGSGAPSAGTNAIGVDVPGIAFLLKPMSANAAVITLVKFGSCPSSDMETNWVKTKSTNRDTFLGNGDPDSSNGSADSWIGQFTYSVAASAATLPGTWSITNVAGDEFPVFTSTAENLGSGTCENGILEITESGGITRLFMTENGSAIVDITGTQSVMGFTRQTIASANDIDGNYIGFAFFGAQGKVYPLAAASTNGTMTVDQLADDTASIQQAGVATISNYQINTPAKGFIKVSLATSVTRPMVCNFGSNLGASSKKILFCVAQDDDGSSTTTKHFNVLLVSK